MSFKNAAGTSPPLSGVYRTVWRWHFYAGVIVMPFLLLLTLTGGLYLFKDEIDRLAYSQMLNVPVRAQHARPQQWSEAASNAAQGRVANLLIPASPTEAVRLRVDRPDGHQRTVFVNPYTAEVTGITTYGGVTETIRKLHSLSLFGAKLEMALNILVEIVAGWAIILCATGLYLWWPRKRQGAVFSLRETDARRRPFWRDLHAVTGFYTAGVIIFLAVTGMPWSAIWGDRFMGMMRDTQLGRPPAPASQPWLKEEPHHAPEGQGWTMEHTVLPLDESHSLHTARPSLERVGQTVRASDMARPFLINIPKDSRNSWTVSTQPQKVEDTRILYIDATSGAVKADVTYGDFGIMAKGMEWGIMVHKGIQYGWINRTLMLGGCIGVWLLAISGTIMWWKRRPPRLSPPSLGAPSPKRPPQPWAVLAIVLPLAILYPLTGISLLVALLIDRIVLRRVRSKRPVSVNL